MDSSKNTKELFKIINRLIGSNTDNPLPPGRTSEETAKDFAEFFLNKINKTQQLFTCIPPYQPRKTDMPRFQCFAPLTQEEVRREIIGMKNKSCELDQIDTSTLKDILTVCLPTIMQIVNMSLTKGNFSEDWETTILKNPELKLIHKNYRLVSNLCFLSKLVEQCMLGQLLDHCTQ